jgi:hypothetical protein
MDGKLSAGELIEKAPMMDAKAFAIAALPVLMEQDNRIAALDAELSELESAKTEVGLPPETTVAELINHHRNNAALGAALEAEADKQIAVEALRGIREYDSHTSDGILEKPGHCGVIARQALSRIEAENG